MNRAEIRLKNESLAELDNYLITRGVPMPVGKVEDASSVAVYDREGNILPSEGKALQRRPDGSIEWLLMDILVSLAPQEEISVFAVPVRGECAGVSNQVEIHENGSEITLRNGLSEVTVSRDGGSLIRKLVLNGKELVNDDCHVDLEVLDGGGKIHRASLNGEYEISVPHSNRLTGTIRIEGKHKARDGHLFLDFALRLTLTVGRPDLKLEHTFYCREEQEGKIPVKAIRLVMPTRMEPSSKKLIKQSHHGHGWFPRTVEIAENVEIVSSSVADLDNYNQGNSGPGVSHPCAGGNVFIRNAESLHEDWSEYPFHMRPGQGSGFRADLQISGIRSVYPFLAWQESDCTLVTSFEHWRQLHPKSISIDEDLIVFSIWPEWASPMQLVQGVSKSHILWLTAEPRIMDMQEIEYQALNWETGYVEPVDISFDPDWPAYCEVLECHEALRYQPAKYPLLENLIEPVPSAGNPARHTYDRQPATGMFHFGDIVTDDASSCVNNEDDSQVCFPLQHFLRTGQTYAWDYGKESARHYMEVDFCEWSTDSRQRGGLIPHTGHHFVGNVYPSHQWPEGILAYYYLSGDERARNVVIAVGDNCCYWAENLIELVCCDGREAGMPLVNLACAYRLTRDEKYIHAARNIIENFHIKWMKKYGELKYPYPQGANQKLISGYGDWSSFAGLYRIWELTGDDDIKGLLLKILKQAIKPGSFSLNDARGMDFLAAWMMGKLTGDMDAVIEIVRQAIPMLLRRGGHPLRRLHFLKELDERGLIDDLQVGTRGGVI